MIISTEPSWSLYRVQDGDRPAYVVAESYQDAIARWKAWIVSEAEEVMASETPEAFTVDNIEDPSGVEYLTDYAELVMPT